MLSAINFNSSPKLTKLLSVVTESNATSTFVTSNTLVHNVDGTTPKIEVKVDNGNRPMPAGIASLKFSYLLPDAKLAHIIPGFLKNSRHKNIMLC